MNSDGSFERYKTRLVGDGKTQEVGIDRGDTFSPVVKPAIIRTVLTLALSQSWSIHQLDVKNAFLHGDLHETVYMYRPVGFRDPARPDYIFRLCKSLYGLKQAPRAWYQRFVDYVSTIGFVESRSDHSLFIYKQCRDTTFLLLYVDDIILTTSSEQLRRSLVSLVNAEFAMKDLGRLSYFLGIDVTHHVGGLFLSQRKYAKSIISQAGMVSCNSSSTPVDSKSKLISSAGSPCEDPYLFRRLVGALQYLTFTRPDIYYVVQQICFHMHVPMTDHMLALKRVIRYIQGTLDYGLHLYKSSSSSLISYTDADWAGYLDTSKCTSGFYIFLGDNLISWSSKHQATISRLSVEAEYCGVANVVSEAYWLRNLLLELHHPLTTATIVYCDNISVIYFSENPVHHQMTKHIEDIFMKGLPQILFLDFRDSLSVRPPNATTAGVY
ncbi:transmembrane signal receptor [Lithospermum erythrorhizon]|uniref:Transmembrane signal receptor n=1 Tax=Lithospermum erythrorhizon TaxID=34254 RepID=A0AAV3QSE7_LITER